jgi:SEC-C motif-containing protein
VATWGRADRPDRLDLDPTVRWTGLQIIATSAGATNDQAGTVEFIASYQSPSGPGELHEVSRFGRDGTRWIYLGRLGPLQGRV